MIDAPAFDFPALAIWQIGRDRPSLESWLLSNSCLVFWRTDCTMGNFDQLDELIREGEELVPKGGKDLVEGYNRQHQAAYASWRERCMVALNEIGPRCPLSGARVGL